MENKFMNINGLKDKTNIKVFNNDFNADYWDFNDYFDCKSICSVVIYFNLNHNGYELLEKKELLEEIKIVIYNRFKSGLKIRTNVIYFLSLKLFIYYMFEKKIFNLKDLTKKDFEDYKKRAKTRNNLNALNGLFKYRSNSKNSLQFKPYEENIVKNFPKTKQTKILEDLEWKKICNHCENKINGFLKSIDFQKKVNNFFEEYYKDNKNFDYIRFEFQKKYKQSILELKKEREDVLIYCCMLIQAYTGMRLSEVLSLKRKCLIKEEYNVENELINILKIKGKTFKYKNSNGELQEEGMETTWYCPEVIEKVVLCMETINDIYYKIYNKEELIINPLFLNKISYVRNLNEKYNKILSNKNIIDKKINTHMFRRTLARLFAKSVLDMPVEVLKEQYKHFDKSITHYYMRDSEKADDSFIELMENYSKEIVNGNNKKANKISKFIKKNIKEAIITANNLEELNLILDNKKLEVVNDYMISLKKEDATLSPIECLSCEGVLIIPDIHLDYWKEMKVLYEELLNSDPNSFWYNKEYNQIKEVVSKLENNEAYITKGK